MRRSTLSSGIQCYWSLRIYTNRNKYLLYRPATWPVNEMLSVAVEVMATYLETCVHLAEN